MKKTSERCKKKGHKMKNIKPGQFRRETRIIIYLFFLVLSTMTITGFTWGKAPDPCAKTNNFYEETQIVITDQLAKQILDHCPDSAVGHLTKGLQFEQDGEVEQAIDEYRAAIKADPSLSQAHGNLGLLLLRHNSDDEAASELTKALPGKPDPRYHRGLAMLLHRGAGKALLLFHSKEALKGNHNDTEARTWLAEAYAGQGQLGRAVEEYVKVLDMEPGNVHARLGLADVYSKSNRPDDAIFELTTAALSDPSNKEIHKNLAVLYQLKGDKNLADREMLLAGLKPQDADIDKLIQQGDLQYLARNYDKAIEAYETVLKKRPSWPDALEKLGDAQMAAGRDDEAAKAYLQTLSLDQSNPSIHYTLGILYERKGLLDKAESEYRKSLRYNPANSDARRRLADIYTLRGNSPQAIAEYREMIKLRGDNPLLHFKLARVYEKNKDYFEAITEYQTAIKLAPDNLEVRKELAALCIRRSILGEAETQYKEILKLKKDDRDARHVLASLYVKQKKYDDLLSLMKEGVEEFPRDPDSHYKLGVMYEFKKEYASAITQYQEAISLKSDHVKAMKALGRLYIKTGDIEKAKGLLEAARTADPNITGPTQLLNSLRDEGDMRSARHRAGSRKGRKARKGSISKRKLSRKKHKG
jgi:tetratricopeptide (TPR) repeat protein